LPSETPVAMTGAMRTSSDQGWDGPANLLSAAAVAADPDSAGRGVMVVFNGKVFTGQTAVKVHATDPDAFAAPHSATIARVVNGVVSYHAASGEQSTNSAAADFGDLSARIALIPVVVGDTGELLDLARPTHDGLVLEAFGSGNVPPGAVPAIRRWIDEGKPVVLATRCPLGQVTPVYAFEGGGSRLIAMGAISAGPRTPSQARMELMISISAGRSYGS
jgi:L-asparaginase